MANLNDILQGLVTTDNKVINRLLSNMNTDISDITGELSAIRSELASTKTDLNTNISDITDELNTIRSDLTSTKADLEKEIQSTIGGIRQEVTNNITILQEQIQRGSGSYAIVDKDTPEKGGSGTLVTDVLASQGQCYNLTTSSSTNYCLYSGVFSDVKYGYYAICARVRIGKASTDSSLVQLKVLNGAQEILIKDFPGSTFSSTSQYYYLYATFKYEGTSGTAKQPLSFQLHTHKVASIPIYFDYAYISMIIPSVFL